MVMAANKNNPSRSTNTKRTNIANNCPNMAVY